MLDGVQGREGSKQATSVIKDLSDEYGFKPGKRAGAKGGMGKGKRAKPPGMNMGGVAMAPPGTKVPAMIKRPPASAPGTKVPAMIKRPPASAPGTKVPAISSEPLDPTNQGNSHARGRACNQKNSKGCCGTSVGW
jgi:hypothetical protein